MAGQSLKLDERMLVILDGSIPDEIKQGFLIGEDYNPGFFGKIRQIGAPLALTAVLYLAALGCGTKSNPTSPNYEGGKPRIGEAAPLKDYQQPIAMLADSSGTNSISGPPYPLISKQDLEAKAASGAVADEIMNDAYNNLQGKNTSLTYDAAKSKYTRLAKIALDRIKSGSPEQVIPGVPLTPGDFNGDGKVDLEDFFMLALIFGSQKGDPNYVSVIDINQNGNVDLEDFFSLALNFGFTQTLIGNHSWVATPKSSFARIPHQAGVTSYRIVTGSGSSANVDYKLENGMAVIDLAGYNGKLQIIGEGNLVQAGTGAVDFNRQGIDGLLINVSGNSQTIVRGGSNGLEDWIEQDGSRIAVPARKTAVVIDPSILPFYAEDFNNDRGVTFRDFLDFVMAFGTKSGGRNYDQKYDLNGNGVVDFPDFLNFVRMFGSLQQRLEGVEFASGYEKPGMAVLYVPVITGIDSLSAVVRNTLKEVKAGYRNGSLKLADNGKLLVPVDTGLNGEEVSYWVVGSGKNPNGGGVLQAACDVGKGRIAMQYLNVVLADSMKNDKGRYVLAFDLQTLPKNGFFYVDNKTNVGNVNVAFNDNGYNANFSNSRYLVHNTPTRAILLLDPDGFGIEISNLKIGKNIVQLYPYNGAIPSKFTFTNRNDLTGF